MTNQSENRTPKETFSGNAAGGLYQGTGEFLGRFCFEGGYSLKKNNVSNDVSNSIVSLRYAQKTMDYLIGICETDLPAAGYRLADTVRTLLTGEVKNLNSVISELGEN
jgi:hypothetical protein